MKTLFTCHYPFDVNAGAAGVTCRLGQEYQKLGHDVQYYFIDELPGKLPELAKFASFPEFTARHIWALCQREAIDVIDASSGDAWVWAKFLQHFSAHRPLIVTRDHGLEHSFHLQYLENAQRGEQKLSWKYPLYRGSVRLWEVEASMRHSDLVLLLNQVDLKYAIDELGVDPDRAHVVANGIPAAFIDLPFEPTPLAADSTIRIAQVSTYIPRKGIRYSAPALNRLLARYPQVQVTLLGTQCFECPEAAQVYADFDPGVRDRIQVIPRFSNEKLPELLKGHQIKLFPTLSEGFSVALTETMACGLAPVTTATAGPLEIVRDGENGLIIPPRDTEAIEQALERLINDREWLDQLRRNAYKTAQNYQWSRVARDNLQCYEKALSP